MRAPNCCPMCGESDGWILIDTTIEYLGIIKALYVCKKCSFRHEYNGEAAKNISIEQIMKEEGFKDSGLNRTWIDKITKATPTCQFCGKTQKLYVKYGFNGGYYFFRCGHCLAVFKCDFSFGGKVKEQSVSIIDCGDINQNKLQIGSCAASILIKDPSIIK